MQAQCAVRSANRMMQSYTAGESTGCCSLSCFCFYFLAIKYSRTLNRK